ncbi:putative Casein kinase II subunit beta [Blattamonas nauphoetae]|uniref:Casein kinase II subunit beta n=1 Tax=Blattamonas nauphoetae TaxID=2049346 RepID=A0ABQ9Y7A1_9EUKA|nr:putative Casein kinase II subunit beta [Blattamonas nauphoetae]
MHLPFQKGKVVTDPYHDADDDSGDEGWVEWFCSLKGNEFFCEVDRSFIEDDFNLTGLSARITNYSRALDDILDFDSEDDNSDSENEEITNSAIELYCRIHQRYLLVPSGLKEMKHKFTQRHFGTCPRLSCWDQPVLPFGPTSEYGQKHVMLFCPRCEEVFLPPSRKSHAVDGAAFGPWFPHLLLMQYPELVPHPSTQIQQHYVPFTPPSHNQPSMLYSHQMDTIFPAGHIGLMFGFRIYLGSHHGLFFLLQHQKAEKEEEQRQYELAMIKQKQDEGKELVFIQRRGDALSDQAYPPDVAERRTFPLRSLGIHPSVPTSLPRSIPDLTISHPKPKNDSSREQQFTHLSYFHTPLFRPRRLLALKTSGFDVIQITSESPELDGISGDVTKTADIVRENARLKAEAVQTLLLNDTDRKDLLSTCPIIAADTLIVKPGVGCYGKPPNLNAAHSYLQELMGTRLCALTGLCIIFPIHNTGSAPKVISLCEQTDFEIKTMTESERNDLFANSNPLDKAGGFSVGETPQIVKNHSSISIRNQECLTLVKAEYPFNNALLDKAIRFFKRFAQEYLITKVLAAVQPHTLPISGNETMINFLIDLIITVLYLADKSSLSYSGITEAVDICHFCEIVFAKVVLPSSHFFSFLIFNRNVITGDFFATFMTLLNSLIQIAPFYRPTLEFILASPIVMGFSSCLSYIDNSLTEWKEEDPEVVQSAKRMIQALFSEGIEDTLEKLLLCKIADFHSEVVQLCHSIFHLLGSNVPYIHF